MSAKGRRSSTSLKTTSRKSNQMPKSNNRVKETVRQARGSRSVEVKPARQELVDKRKSYVKEDVPGKSERSSIYTESKTKYMESENCFQVEEENDDLKRVFDAIKQDYDSLSLKTLFDIMISRGICPNDDSRLSKVKEALETTYKGRRLNEIIINYKLFKKVSSSASEFIVKVLENSLAIKDMCDWMRCLSIYHEAIKQITKEDLNVSLTSVDGQKWRLGQTNRLFPMNELVHILTYSMAMETMGFDKIHERVGLEAKPCSDWAAGNPLIGAGALAVVAHLLYHTLGDMKSTERHESVQKLVADMAGGAQIQFDSKSFVGSERKSEYLKAQLSWMISNDNMEGLCRDVDKVAQFYLECSSLQVDATGLSAIGAALANGGLCPMKSHKILSCECVEKVLSVMTATSGKAGVPIVSCSSGAVLLVVPGILGLAIHSEDPSATTFFLSAIFRHFSVHPYEMTFLGMGRCKEVTSFPESALFSTARSGDIFTLSSLLYTGVSLTTRDYMNRTILHVAAAHGQLPYIAFVVSYCPQLVTTKNIAGSTPLDEAKFFKHKEIEEFLDNWATVSTTAKKSSTLTSESSE